MYFKSKVSYPLLAIIFILFYGPLLRPLFNTANWKGATLLLVILTFVFGGIIHLFHNTIYTIEEETLHIKSGFFRYPPIAIKDIKKIEKTNNLIASPAASFDRIEIYFGKFDSIVLSPKDKQKFAAALIKINPNIQNALK
jgi:hypothetical protein